MTQQPTGPRPHRDGVTWLYPNYPERIVIQPTKDDTYAYKIEKLRAELVTLNERIRELEGQIEAYKNAEQARTNRLSFLLSKDS